MASSLEDLTAQVQQTNTLLERLIDAVEALPGQIGPGGAGGAGAGEISTGAGGAGGAGGGAAAALAGGVAGAFAGIGVSAAGQLGKVASQLAQNAGDTLAAGGSASAVQGSLLQGVFQAAGQTPIVGGFARNFSDPIERATQTLVNLNQARAEAGFPLTDQQLDGLADAEIALQRRGQSGANAARKAIGRSIDPEGKNGTRELVEVTKTVLNFGNAVNTVTESMSKLKDVLEKSAGGF